MTGKPLPADFAELATELVFGRLVERARGGGEAWEGEILQLNGRHAIGYYKPADGWPADYGVAAAESGEGETLGLEGLGV